MLGETTETVRAPTISIHKTDKKCFIKGAPLGLLQINCNKISIIQMIN